MNTKYFAVLFGFLLAFMAPRVHAITVPSFPTCAVPQGSVKVSYSEGTHGIAGNTGTYTGSDTVYTLSDTSLMQCFCADDGSAIQSNWLKIAGATDEEIQVLKNQGWIYVPNGALWGLSSDPYMVFNSSYSCQGGTGGGGEERVGGASAANGAMGLAATGNTTTIVGLVITAVASTIAFALLKKRG